METGMELVPVQETGFLTPALLTLPVAVDERDFTDEQFALVEAVARTPPAPLEPASNDDVRNIVGALAGLLKAPRTSAEAGAFKLGMYRKALAGRLSARALAFAADRAIVELEWMPTPAEIIRLAAPFTAPEHLAHARATRLVGERRHRLHDEQCRAVAQKAIPMGELSALPRAVIDRGIELGALLWMPDGALLYRTPETIRAAKEMLNAAQKPVDEGEE